MFPSVIRETTSNHCTAITNYTDMTAAVLMNYVNRIIKMNSACDFRKLVPRIVWIIVLTIQTLYNKYSTLLVNNEHKGNTLLRPTNSPSFLCNKKVFLTKSKVIIKTADFFTMSTVSYDDN